MHLIDTCIILLLVVINPEIKDCPRPQFVAEKDAVEELFIVMVVVCDDTQGKGAGELLANPLCYDIDLVYALSSSVLPKSIIPVAVEQSEVGHRFECQHASVGDFVPQVGIF